MAAPKQKKSRKGVGGHANHRPDCACNPCKAKRRQESMQGPEAPLQKAMIDLTDPDLVREIAIEALPKNDYRSKVAKWAQITMEEPKATNQEIAARLGISERSLRGYIGKARAEGFLQLAEPKEILEHESIPEAVRVVNGHLKEGSLKAAIEVLKGMGVLKSHSAIQQEAEVTHHIPPIELRLPADFTAQMAQMQGVVGRGNEVIIDAEVIERSPEALPEASDG